MPHTHTLPRSAIVGASRRRRASTVRSTMRRIAAALTLVAVAAAGALVASVASSPPAGALTLTSGYWMIDGEGRLYNFGAADAYDQVPLASGASAVKIESTADGKGAWIADSLGNVYVRGSAKVYGGAPFLNNGERIVTLSRTPTGLGYWLTSSTGRTFERGDATRLGDITDFTPNRAPLNQPIIDSAPTVDGKGLYLVALDGGVFSMGGATFHGSMGGTRLNSPVRSLVPDPDGDGYWLIAGDGGVFAFDADFRGSMGSTPLNKPVVGMVAFGNGYLQVAADGGIFTFSDKDFYGSLGGQNIPADIVGVAAFSRAPFPTTISTASLPEGRVNQSYFVQLAGGALTPSTWAVSGLPTGLTASTSGLITGTPTAGGTSTVTVRLTGDDLGTTSRTFSLTVTTAAPMSITALAPVPSGNTNNWSVSANVTGPVAGVDFYVDGIILDTQNHGAVSAAGSTYSQGFNAWTRADGSHTLTAVARPSSGSASVTSTPVTFTIANLSTTGDFTRPLVSMSFDDGWISHYTVVKPALDTRNLKATFFLLSNPTHPLDGNRYPYMSLAQTIDLRNDTGMELAAHTIDHPHLIGPAFPGTDEIATLRRSQQSAGWLTDNTATAVLTPTGRAGQYADVKNWLATTINVAGTPGFASPYGETDATVRAEIASNFSYHRTITPGENGRNGGRTIDKNNLLTFNVRGTTTWMDIEGQMALARKHNSYLVLVFHDQLDAAPVDVNSYDNTPANLNLMLDAVVRSGVTVKPIKDALTELGL